MNNDLLRRAANMLSRRGALKNPWFVGLAVLLVGYSFAAPWLNQKYGLALPALDGSRHEIKSTDAEGGFSRDFSDFDIPEINLDFDGSSSASQGEQAIIDAFKNGKSDMIVTATFTVKKNLRDDTTGSAHQKAIVELPSGLSLLLAHNIDLADRVPMREGDTVEIRGEYEYSEKGGVIHWTHHDPRGRHDDGWIKHAGKTFK